MVGDDYEVFDIVGEYDALPSIKVYPDTVCTVYVDKSRYDEELLQGQETTIKAFMQASKDLPRSQCFVNGRSTTRIGCVFPLRFIRYCTQAVMAFPMELLSRSMCGIVAECTNKTPMFVYATDSDVYIYKRMRLLQLNDDNVIVDIHIFADDGDTVTITFRFAVDQQPQVFHSKSLMHSCELVV